VTTVSRLLKKLKKKNSKKDETIYQQKNFKKTNSSTPNISKGFKFNRLILFFSSPRIEQE
jgi:hypothetical protein